jgi:predicted component of type VI protein secretion system
MGAVAAVSEALRDLRLHELATLAAMQAAARALLAEFEPARLSAGRAGFDLVPMQRKAHAWDRFEALHARIAQALADDFDSVFGKAFARAYEEALAAASAREPEP